MEAQRLHVASEQREVTEGNDGPSATTVVRNAPEKTGFADALKPTKTKLTSNHMKAEVVLIHLDTNRRVLPSIRISLKLF
jgi:hypothetical protein